MPGGLASVRADFARHGWFDLARGPIGWGLVLAFGLVGCDQSAEIVVERVPKDDVEPLAAPVAEGKTPTVQRMLAAMVLGNNEAIFFKVTGPPDAIEAQRESFLELVSSFKPGDPPQWTAPEGWTETAGPAPRLATIIAPAEPPLELSVTSLSLPENNQDAYRLANVNRWRRQLGLTPIEQADLHADAESGSETFKVPLEGDAFATVVDIEGRASGGMGAPFASMMRSSVTPGTANTGRGVSEETGEAGDGLAFEKPEGWTKAPGNAFSQAAFSVEDARVTVSALSASANDLLANINRWRRQVGLDSIEEAELKDSIQTITLGDGKEGNYVVLAGSQGQSMLGVIAVREETMWFVKMLGSDETIASEKPRFEAFVNSLRFK